jgi:hypothetical protein
MKQQEVARSKVYVFSGRIHPERYEWGINPAYEAVLCHADSTSSLLRISIIASQVNVTVQTNSNDLVLEMKNLVARQVRSVVDALGYVTGAALDVEIINCIDPGGNHLVFNTAFDRLLQNEPGSAESQRLFNVLLSQANLSQFVHMALADLRSAISQPLDTCVNCYRAVESIRHEYLEGKSDDEARKESWKRLRDALGVDKADLLWLEERAKPRRHGEPIDVTHAERERALRLARRVIEEHCLSRQDPSSS